MTWDYIRARNGTFLIHAEKKLAAHYAVGDVVAFHRSYLRLGVDKGDELRVTGVAQDTGTVNLIGKHGNSVAW